MAVVRIIQGMAVQKGMDMIGQLWISRIHLQQETAMNKYFHTVHIRTQLFLVVEVVKANTTTQAKQLMAVVAVPRLPLTS